MALEIAKICELCDTHYFVNVSSAEHDKNTYCSKECEEDYSNSRD